MDLDKPKTRAAILFPPAGIICLLGLIGMARAWGLIKWDLIDSPIFIAVYFIAVVVLIVCLVIVTRHDLKE